jgi:radical SAM protein with 4Fe4S-binding SPASM domain
MDYSLFTRGIDDVVENKIGDTVGLYLMGEPLLYPQIYQAIAYANDRGLRTQLTTNGSLLTKERVHKIVASGLDKMTISLQMVGDTDHAYRQAALPFDRYYQRIIEAVRQIQNLSGPTEVLVLLMNTSTLRLIDFDEPKNFVWDRTGFKRKLITILQDVCSATGTKSSPEQLNATVNKLSLYRGELLRISDRVLVSVRPLFDWGNAFTQRKIYPARIGFCSLAFTSIGVLSNGEVTVCCSDYDGKTSLGNLRNSSLATILSSEQAQTIARGFQRMTVSNPYCQRCIGGTSPIKTVLRILFTITALRILGYGPGKTLKERSLYNA